MKNQILLLACCLAFMVSGVAQPQTNKHHNKMVQKIKSEKFNNPMSAEKEKALAFKQHISSPKMQSPINPKNKATWWEPETIYEYDEYDNISRHSFTYQNGKCIVNLMQYWYEEDWEDYGRRIYTYDAQNNITEILWQWWDDELWESDLMMSYTYNEQNKVTSFIIKSLYSDNWENDWKEIYIYDAQNNNIEIIVQGWEMDEWMDLAIITMKYDVQNRLMEELYQYWNEGWVIDGKFICNYDTENNLTEKVGNMYEDGQWWEVMRIVFTYDSQRNRTSELWQYFEWHGEWENLEKWTCTYDVNNNAISGNYQYWDDDTWVYDDENYLHIYYNNMQSSYGYYEMNNYYGFAYGSRFTATYIDPYTYSVKENNLLNSSVKIYPNPVSHILHIETTHLDVVPEVKIFSLQGVLLMQTKGGDIDVSSLPNGIYIAEVAGIFKKIVKQ
ncbi:MAG: T9SS type A sorting domain-containing protein [Lentimicrobiaceae bacterium]|nr:T9SS type A sorting domain-containing protein [Lentimicrobiaceae bacterium]